VHWYRKKAISRGGGIPALVAVLAGASAEGSMHAAQSLLQMAKLPDLKVDLFLVAICLHLLLPHAVSVHCRNLSKVSCYSLDTMRG